jgi:hypothetical protein
MQTSFVVLCVIFFASIILWVLLDTIDISNPFNIKVNIPESFVERFQSATLNLNEDTNKLNPMLKISPKKNKQKRNLVFTSAGDNTKFDSLWTNENEIQNYDIFVVYYGTNEAKFNKYKQNVDYILKRKGSKFQNFHYVWTNYLNIMDKYDRFFILDDDIIFNSNDINRMFAISKKYKLDICGPTFKNDNLGKISHHITHQQKGDNIRYTNFVEVNVPLFSKPAIEKFMEYYDPILIGWGIDYFYIWANGLEKKRSYALVDGVSCINPHDNKKGNKREHNKIKNHNKEYQYWISIKNKYNIKDHKVKTWHTEKIKL